MYFIPEWIKKYPNSKFYLASGVYKFSLCISQIEHSGCWNLCHQILHLLQFCNFAIGRMCLRPIFQEMGCWHHLRKSPCISLILADVIYIFNQAKVFFLILYIFRLRIYTVQIFTHSWHESKDELKIHKIKKRLYAF